MELIKKFKKGLFPKELKNMGVDEQDIKNAASIEKNRKEDIPEEKTEEMQTKEEIKTNYSDSADRELSKLKHSFNEQTTQMLNIMKEMIKAHNENYNKLSQETRRINEELKNIRLTIEMSQEKDSIKKSQKKITEIQTKIDSKEEEKPKTEDKKEISPSDVSIEKYFYYNSGKK